MIELDYAKIREIAATLKALPENERDAVLESKERLPNLRRETYLSELIPEDMDDILCLIES